MRNYEAEFEQMDPDSIVQLVRELEAKLEPTVEKVRTPEEIEQTFELLHGYAAVGQHDKAAEVFDHLHSTIAEFRKRDVDAEKALRFLIDWSLLALRYTPEQRETFVCLPIYKDLFAAIETGPEKMKYQAIRAQLQLIRHFDFWQSQGRNPEALPAEEREMLETAVSSFPETAEAALEKAQADEHWEALVRICRYASSFYLSARKPNEAIRSLKLAIQYIPQTENYHVADAADLNMQLGTVFLEYKKYDVSIKYFQTAKDLYESEGDELEMFAFQAEGWIEEAERRKNL